jgi:hypothetical protein
LDILLLADASEGLLYRGIRTSRSFDVQEQCCISSVSLAFWQGQVVQRAQDALQARFRGSPATFVGFAFGTATAFLTGSTSGYLILSLEEALHACLDYLYKQGLWLLPSA